MADVKAPEYKPATETIVKKVKKSHKKVEPKATELRTEWTPFGIKFTRSKGSIPLALRGLYTDTASAERARASFYSQGKR